MGRIIIYRVRDSSETKAKIQSLIDEASRLQQRLLGPMEPQASHNKFLMEAREAMQPVISALKEAKGFA